MRDEYKKEGEKAVAEARERLTELFAQREAIDIEIAKQQRRVAALAILIDDSEESHQDLNLNLGGLTDAVRGVLRGAGNPGLTPAEIRTRLIQLYFPVNGYRNFGASLHSVLNRLVKAKEVRQVEVASVVSGARQDETFYQWILRFPRTRAHAPKRKRG